LKVPAGQTEAWPAALVALLDHPEPGGTTQADADVAAVVLGSVTSPPPQGVQPTVAPSAMVTSAARYVSWGHSSASVFPMTALVMA
jgi:hypothetical protein